MNCIPEYYCQLVNTADILVYRYLYVAPYTEAAKYGLTTEVTKISKFLFQFYLLVSESSFYFHEQLLEALLQNENDTSFSE
jgi:hypothetical protein